MTARLAAIVLHFRTPERTMACLRSLAAEGVPEAVLVDNSEDDGVSLGMMRADLDVLPASGLRVQVLSPTRNLGFAAGVNRGIEQVLASAPARVLLINSDARLMPGALAMLESALTNGSDVALPSLYVPGASNSVRMLSYQRWFALLLPGNYPGVVSFPSGTCLLLSERFVRRGLFDENFFFYWEDVALGEAVRRGGGHIERVDAARVEHEGGSSARNGSLFYEYHIVRGHWLLARTLTRTWFGFALAIAGRALALPVRSLWRTVRSGRVTPLQALWMATSDVFRGRCHDLTPPAKSVRAVHDWNL